MSHQALRSSHFWSGTLVPYPFRTGFSDHPSGVTQVARSGRGVPILDLTAAPPPRPSPPHRAPAHPAGRTAKGHPRMTTTSSHPAPGPHGVFDRASGHEQVVFCHDEPTGLKAI